MAKCDQGYLCEVCGTDVAEITDSDLYLRYVIGEIDSRALLAAPELLAGAIQDGELGAMATELAAHLADPGRTGIGDDGGITKAHMRALPLPDSDPLSRMGEG